MELRIVPMEERHLDQVTALERTCFTDPWTRNMLAEALAGKNTRGIVAESPDGTVVGYAFFTAVLDEGSLDNIAVDPAYRGRGLGRHILSTLLKAYEPHLSLIYLEVRSSNQAAIRLYEHMGFETVGRRRGYYESPREDAILMTKFLSPKAGEQT